MKRISTILIILSASAIMTFAQTLSERYNAKHPLVVVCDWDKPPYEFLNDEGEPAGTNIDLMRAIAKELNIPVKFVMKEWSIALKTFERGDADIIIANGRRYRKEPYVVSGNIVNYYRIRVVTLAADSTELVTMRQLEQEGAVFKTGDYSAHYFIENDSANIKKIEYQTPKIALMGIIHGDYKYFVWGEEPLKWKIKELNLEGLTLNDVGIPISEIHFIGRDRQLIEEIDDQYSRLKQRGDVAVIQDRWLHPETIVKQSDYSWVYISLAILALAAILWLFSRLARRHVISATRASRELNEMMSQALHMGNFTVMEYDIAHDLLRNRYGHVLPDEGLTLEEFTSRIHPDQQEEFRQKVRSLLDGRERHFELNKRWNAGTIEEPKWLTFNGHAICELNEVGQPAYIVNAIHDVTQEMEEDRVARNLVHQYQVLTNLPFVAISFYDKDGRLITLNDAMRELCGMTTDDNAKRFWENISIFDTPIFRGVYSKGSRDNILFCQHMVYPDFGIDRYIEANIMPLINAEGEIVNYFCTAFDISEARQNSLTLRQLQRTCKETQEEIDLQFDRLKYLLTNSERYIVRTNIEHEQIAFYQTPDKPLVIHTFSGFQRVIAPEERQPMMDILYDTKTREPHTCTIHTVQPTIAKPGAVYNITLNPVYDKQGTIIGHEGITNNISTLVNTRQRLADETRLAEDSYRMKSAFMASMTHELRTPLNAIVGFTSVIEALSDSPERGEYVRIVRNSSDMLQRLINDIIEASTITDGSIAIEPSDVDFAQHFDDICITLAQRVQNPNVEFLKDSPCKHLYIALDIARIQQVLTNFVTNAVKFTTEGHIRLGYRYEEEKGGLYLYCEDTGAGIPRDKQAIVFDRFVKLDEFVQGTGMGLAISKSIIERCGGEIGVHSDGAGHGSTFWAFIPCSQKMATTRDACQTCEERS